MISLAQTGTYARGDMIRAVLRFRWQGEFDVVRVDLDRTILGGAAFGNQIVLRSRSLRRVADEGEPYTLAVLEGEVPDSVRPGTYTCKRVRCLVPKRGWVTLFEDVQDIRLRIVDGPPASSPGKERAEFLALEFEPWSGLR